VALTVPRDGVVLETTHGAHRTKPPSLGGGSQVRIPSGFEVQLLALDKTAVVIGSGSEYISMGDRYAWSI